MVGDFEPVSVIDIAHGLKAQSHALGITVLTTGADLSATCYRVPGGFSPFDLTQSSHSLIRFQSLRQQISLPLGFAASLIKHMYDGLIQSLVALEQESHEAISGGVQ